MSQHLSREDKALLAVELLEGDNASENPLRWRFRKTLRKQVTYTMRHLAGPNVALRVRAYLAMNLSAKALRRDSN